MRLSTHIAAVGARTPVGVLAETSAAAVRADISRLALQSQVLDPFGDPLRAAMDPALDPDTRGWERLAALAQPALVEVCRKLVASSTWLRPIDVILALPEPRPGWTQLDSEHVASALGRLAWTRLGPLRVTLGAQGHAGVLAAMDAATRNITAGTVDLCIVGGVDSYFHPETIAWLEKHGQLVMEDIPIGFSPGEAAGFVALASSRALRLLQLPSLATLIGSRVAHERHLIKTDAINLGEGLTTAIAGAVSGLPAGELVDTIYCDINGERYRSEEWGFVALALPHACRDMTVFEAPAVSWGDVGAASGALFSTLAVSGWRRNYARGSTSLLWAGSEGGLRAAVVLRRGA